MLGSCWKAYKSASASFVTASFFLPPSHALLSELCQRRDRAAVVEHRREQVDVPNVPVRVPHDAASHVARPPRAQAGGRRDGRRGQLEERRQHGRYVSLRFADCQRRVPSATTGAPTTCSCRSGLPTSRVRMPARPLMPVTTFFKCTKQECGFQWREN